VSSLSSIPQYLKMKQHLNRYFFFATSLCVLITLCSWGIWGHEHINHAAVFALPEEMRTFYYNHIDFITIESTGPDMKRGLYNDKSEGPKHYIDIELFNKPIDSLAQTPQEKAKVYSDSLLQKTGSLPWQIQDMMAKLTKAFKDKHKSEILLLSADLAHYLGDANMPLHTSYNYDGKLTNQSGIHAFWESRLPEQFGETYNLNTRDARYINDVTKETWHIIKNTNQLVDTLLAIDRKVRATLGDDKLYKKDEQGNQLKSKYNSLIQSDEYAKALHTALGGMVEAQLKNSITAVADFWYTAWVNGGKPDLRTLDDAELTTDNKASLAKDYAAWKKGKLTKMKVDSEF
jgi:hypothetical protein